jgi:hypothetical protein
MRVIAEGHLIHDEMIGQRTQSSQAFVAICIAGTIMNGPTRNRWPLPAHIT